MSGKRIVFSTATPNDQGGIITNDSIDFKRYKTNPVVLCQHDWSAPPLGLMTDIKEIDGKLTGVPVFHRLSAESILYADLYEGGWLKACSIGGEAEWKANSAGQLDLKNGLKQCNRFNLYEVSLVTLPSNADATVMDEKLAAKIYDKTELQTISDAIVTLSSQFKIPQMELVKTKEQLELEAAQKLVADDKAKKEAEAAAIALAAKNADDPSASQLPGVIKHIVTAFTNLMGSKPVTAAAPAPSGEPSSKTEDPKMAQPNPTGLEAKRAAAKMKADEMAAAAALALEAAAAAKEKADKEGSTKEDKDGYAAAYSAAEKACNEALEADEAYKSALDATDDADMEAREKAAKEKKSALAAKPGAVTAAAKPTLKTMEQLQAEKLKLAPKPGNAQARVLAMKGVRFEELNSPKNEEGKRIMGRVMTSDGGEKNIEDYRIVAQSIIDDGRFSAVTEKLRIIQNVDESKLGAYRRKNEMPKDRNNQVGMDMKMIMEQLSSGSIEVLDRASNRLVQRTALNSTDNALAAPALTTIEWMTQVIFALFPTSSWRDGIPMFPAEVTTKNTGLIFPNITADPAIYRGNDPSPAADYTNTDAAVALTLIPYFLQPMLWKPLTMHQFRYDQMATQWAQAFAKWAAVMDDELIFILSGDVPVGSIVISGGQAIVKQFALAAGQANPNNFFYNPNYTGALATPAYNDIMSIEQIYNNQNFQIASEKLRLVIDPTMEKFIKQDPDTKSLLTRWVESNSTDLLKISHTELIMRSRVAAYDQATGLIKDPTGVLPNTVISAALGFIASQVGMGLGMLDVFMIQDPSNYGFRMSADIRIGIVPVRAGFQGLSLYTYGPAVNAPANV